MGALTVRKNGLMRLLGFGLSCIIFSKLGKTRLDKKTSVVSAYNIDQFRQLLSPIHVILPVGLPNHFSKYLTQDKLEQFNGKFKRQENKGFEPRNQHLNFLGISTKRRKPLGTPRVDS